MTPQVMTVSVTRYRCVWCGRTRAKRSAAVEHAERCSRNPASRSCSTCQHFTPRPCCPAPSDNCGCRGLNECAVGAFETWRYNNHDTLAPEPNGWWTHTVDWRRGCPHWTGRPQQ